MLHDVTLNDLLARLGAAADRPVAFRTPQGAVRAGYHLTEFKLAHVRSVDCGRGTHEWNEAIVELLDGGGGAAEPMRSSKLSAIVKEVVGALPAMGDAPLVIEFGSDGLARYRIEAVEPHEESGSGERGGDGWVVLLAPLRGQCKPVSHAILRAPQREPASASCCGAS